MKNKIPTIDWKKRYLDLARSVRVMDHTPNLDTLIEVKKNLELAYYELDLDEKAREFLKLKTEEQQKILKDKINKIKFFSEKDQKGKLN